MIDYIVMSTEFALFLAVIFLCVVVFRRNRRLSKELEDIQRLLELSGTVIRKPAIGDLEESRTRSWTGMTPQREGTVPPGSAVSWSDTPSPDRASRERR